MTEQSDPLLQPWTGPLGAPPFARIGDDQFLRAVTTSIAWHKAELDAICEQVAPATFENTIAALERSGEPLARVRRLFWALS